jgi:hypothetical protein
MTDRGHIDMRLKDGRTIRDSEHDGITIFFENGESVRLSDADLADARRTRVAFYEQIGLVIPHYDDEQHFQIVCALFGLCGYREVAPRAAEKTEQ